MSNLPPLPEPKIMTHLGTQCFTADQMRSFAEEAVRLEREPYRQLIELYQHSDMTDDEFVIRAIDLFGESIRARSQEG
jgi:hypothetical protein